MQDQVTSIIRTIVPYIIGAIVSFFAAKGINAPSGLFVDLSGILTFGFGTLYYVVVRAIEHKYPKAGILLGSPSQPTYK